jgi:hypothetical protein
VGNLNTVKLNQRRFAPTPAHITGIRCPLHRNTQAEAKIIGYVWHCNRHTFCSWLAMAGATIKEIQELAGHKTVTMSARYAHLSPDHKLAVIDRIAAAATAAATETAIERTNSHQNSHQQKQPPFAEWLFLS